MPGASPGEKQAILAQRKAEREALREGVPKDIRILIPMVDINILMKGPLISNEPLQIFDIPDINLNVSGTFDLSVYVKNPSNQEISSTRIVNQTGIVTYNSTTMVLTGASGGSASNFQLGVTTGGTETLSNVFTAIVTGTATGHDFPRIASYQVGGGTTLADPARMARYAPSDLIICGFFFNWVDLSGRPDGPFTVDQTVQAIRAINPTAYIFPYTSVGESNVLPTGDPRSAILEAEDWWLYTSTGAHTSHFAGQWSANTTDWVAVDAQGRRWPQACADLYGTDMFSLTTYDGCFTDVTIHVGFAEDSADWDLNSGTPDVSQSSGSPNFIPNEPVYTKCMEGHVAYHNRIATNEGSQFLRLANTSQHPNYPPWPDLYKQIFDGVLNEKAIGTGPQYTEQTFGFSTLMSQYKNQMDVCKGEISVIMCTRAGSDTEAEYQEIRMALCLTLMDNGYFAAQLNDAYNDAKRYDEFDVNLGQPIDLPQTTAWSQGVWRREFDNGLALLNPKGNGQQTVNVGAGWKSFTGTQSPTVNNGANKSSVTLQDRDGIILVRQ
jgi:hypothetical protein